MATDTVDTEITDEFEFVIPFTKRVEDPDNTYVSGPVLIPETVDAQGDIVSEEEIKKTAWDFMMDLQTGNAEAGFMHKQALDDDDAMFVESYLLPAKRTISKIAYPKGTWFLGAVVWNEDLRKRIKKGEVRGFSIGGRGKSVEEPADE